MPNLKLPQINSITIAGRLARDPELKHTPTNIAVCSSSLAHDGWSKKDGKKTDFYDLVAFNKTAEIMAEMRKGNPVLIEGNLSTEEWEFQGKTQRRVKIIVNRVHVLEWPEKEGDGNAQARANGVAVSKESDDDIPF